MDLGGMIVWWQGLDLVAQIGVAAAFVTFASAGIGLARWLLRRRRARVGPERVEEDGQEEAQQAPFVGLAARPAVNTEGFRAREVELARLSQLVGDGKCVVWVTGPTQAGKTWLVSQWVEDNGYAERFARFELEAGATLAGLLEGINSFLCRHDERGFDRACQAPEATTEQRVAALVRVLGQRQWVILLDSFEKVSEAAEMRDFAARLQQDLRQSRVLLGSQVMPYWGDANAEAPISEIGEKAGFGILAQQGVAEEHHKALYEKVDGLPGALVRIGALVRNRGISAATKELKGTAAEVGEQLLGETFDALSEGGQRLWAGMCLLPAPMTRETARALCARDDFDASWDELARWKLLPMVGDRAELHPLARAVGEKRLGEMKAWARGCGERIARYYAQFAKEKAGDRAAVEAELENVLAAARLAFQCREWEALWGMGRALDDPLDYAGRWTAREELLRLCYDAAGEAKDKQRRAGFANNLGIALQDRGKVEEAEDFYNQSLEIEREVGDRPGEAVSLHQLGNVAYLWGKLEEAEGLYRQSLEIDREVGDRPGEAKTLHQLGMVAQDRGEMEEAEGFYNQSLGIAREVGNRPGEAKTLHQLGMVAQQRGKLEEAEDFYNQSLEIEREVGNRPGEAFTLAQMALLAEAQGRLGLAVERTEGALSIFENLRLPQSQRARQQLERLRNRLAEEENAPAGQ